MTQIANFQKYFLGSQHPGSDGEYSNDKRQFVFFSVLFLFGLWQSYLFSAAGDIGHYDEQGHLYVIDRLKELIKYQAYQFCIKTFISTS